jgi:hypothetical protein
MLTPGIAGMLDLTISKSLQPILPVNIFYLLLGFGFLIGTVVLINQSKLHEKILYYILNSLIIYCVAFGLYGTSSNTTIEQISPPASSPTVQDATTFKQVVVP